MNQTVAMTSIRGKGALVVHAAIIGMRAHGASESIVIFCRAKIIGPSLAAGLSCTVRQGLFVTSGGDFSAFLFRPRFTLFIVGLISSSTSFIIYMIVSL